MDHKIPNKKMLTDKPQIFVVRAACGGKVSTLLGGGTIIPSAIN
jgi:hypothetical protein